jgi:sterol desaturase/sphingolipid hydroxylase (fatty acid hydroxylase superfamily)
MQYWWFLAGISVLFVLLERLWPWRPEQPVLRRGLAKDLFYLAFNGHFLGLLLALAFGPLWRWLDGATGDLGLSRLALASAWPLGVQLAVAIVGLDLIQWSVHNLLHRVGGLWKFHQVHHSIVQMDWIGVMRFHWMEVIVYKSAQYLPLVVMGFSPTALLIFAVFGTFMGHFNHSNLRWRIGPLGYLLNNPRMHIWHHHLEPDHPVLINFGINFSLWDWIFGTAHQPDHPPAALGVPPDSRPPEALWRQLLWPLGR